MDNKSGIEDNKLVKECKSQDDSLKETKVRFYSVEPYMSGDYKKWSGNLFVDSLIWNADLRNDEVCIMVHLHDACIHDSFHRFYLHSCIGLMCIR